MTHLLLHQLSCRQPSISSSVRVSASSTATVSTAPFYTFKSFRVPHLHHVRCMANPRRVKMVAKQIRRELSDMLLTDKNLQYAVLPEVALGADRYLSSLTTISDVEVSADLQVVKVYVSIFGDERGRDVAIAGLKAKAKYVRSQLGKRMKLRLTPEIRFIEDESFERGSRVIAILDKIKSDNEKKNAKSQEKKEESPDLPSYDEDWDDDDADEDIIYVE
ncbi:hypothetical protein Nepgr_015314 [Nepenthes gracilis]|uniref:Ribosome-binding factor A, chloroplastic n=1 Tax=Nepenthes gracilis TaxID=150966 RepID=A0AAD3SKW6_NEPGR|nr:hypothetical protein Nepgr_015314 [Nepenthes gracilis]